MADIVTGGRPVNTGFIPMVDFAKNMRAAQSETALNKDANLITPVNVKLYAGDKPNGQPLPDDQRASYNGRSTITVNLGKMANVPGSVLDTLGTSQPNPCKYTGNTEKGTPITVDTYTRLAEQNPDRRKGVGLVMDLTAVANANDMERDEGRRAKGLDPIMTGDPKADRKNPSLGRIPTTMQDKTTFQGVAAMNQGRLAANLGEMTAVNQLLTTPGPNADARKGVQSAVEKYEAGVEKYAPTKDDIDKVSKLIATEYAGFVDKYADKGCPGIKAMEKQEDGSYKPGKTVIEGTKTKSLKEMGFAPVHLDGGAVALVCVDGSKDAVDARKGDEGLRAFDNAFNKHMAQKISQEFESGSVARSIGLQTSIASYPVTPPDAGVTMIQPSTVFESKPFARSLTTSIECATHNNQRSIEDIYGRALLDKVAETQTYFPKSVEGERADAGKDKVMEEIRAKQPAATKAFDAPEY